MRRVPARRTDSENDNRLEKAWRDHFVEHLDHYDEEMFDPSPSKNNRIQRPRRYLLKRNRPEVERSRANAAEKDGSSAKRQRRIVHVRVAHSPECGYRADVAGGEKSAERVHRDVDGEEYGDDPTDQNENEVGEDEGEVGREAGDDDDIADEEEKIAHDNVWVNEEETSSERVESNDDGRNHGRSNITAEVPGQENEVDEDGENEDEEGEMGGEDAEEDEDEEAVSSQRPQRTRRPTGDEGEEGEGEEGEGEEGEGEEDEGERVTSNQPPRRSRRATENGVRSIKQLSKATRTLQANSMSDPLSPALRAASAASRRRIRASEGPSNKPRKNRRHASPIPDSDDGLLRRQRPTRAALTTEDTESNGGNHTRLVPKLFKAGRFSADEDRVLIEGLKQYGWGSWTLISKYCHSRTGGMRGGTAWKDRARTLDLNKMEYTLPTGRTEGRGRIAADEMENGDANSRRSRLAEENNDGDSIVDPDEDED